MDDGTGGLTMVTVEELRFLQIWHEREEDTVPKIGQVSPARGPIARVRTTIALGSSDNLL